MREQDIICTVCPMGCHIHVTAEGDKVVSVVGNSCPRGEQYAKDEFTCPVRTLTTSVMVNNSTEPLLPVRSEKPIPKAQMFTCMKLIKGLTFEAPIARGQVLVEDLDGTGVNLIACTERVAVK